METKQLFKEMSIEDMMSDNGGEKVYYGGQLPEVVVIGLQTLWQKIKCA